MSWFRSYTEGVGSSFGVQVDFKNTDGFFKRLWSKITHAGGAALERSAQLIVERVRQYIRDEGPMLLNRGSREGSFEDSIGYTVSKDRVTITSSHPNAMISEYGGLITSKTWMTVPISPEARTFEARYFRGASRSFKNNLRLAAINGKLFLVEGHGRESKIHYVLRKSVNFPPRAIFSRVENDPFVDNEIQKFTNKEFEIRLTG